jgi:hypothetical protein
MSGTTSRLEVDICSDIRTPVQIAPSACMACMAEFLALSTLVNSKHGTKTRKDVVRRFNYCKLDSAEFSYAAKAWTSADSGIGSGR